MKGKMLTAKIWFMCLIIVLLVLSIVGVVDGRITLLLYGIGYLLILAIEYYVEKGNKKGN